MRKKKTARYAPSKVAQTSKATPGKHGAQVAKATHVDHVSPEGFPVNPWHRCGAVTPNRYPYRPDQTEWAAENK
jgi:hypothetical protein